jgi:hypothetical protein
VLVLVGHSLGGALVVRTAAAVNAARTAAMRAAMPPRAQPPQLQPPQRALSTNANPSSEAVMGLAAAEPALSGGKVADMATGEAAILARGGLPAETGVSTSAPPASADSSPLSPIPTAPSPPPPPPPAPLVLNATIAAVVVMDVVEGTAIAALDHMHGIIKVHIVAIDRLTRC